MAWSFASLRRLHSKEQRGDDFFLCGFQNTITVPLVLRRFLDWQSGQSGHRQHVAKLPADLAPLAVWGGACLPLQIGTSAVRQDLAIPPSMSPIPS